MGKGSIDEKGITIRAENVPKGVTKQVLEIQMAIQKQSGIRVPVWKVQMDAIEKGLESMLGRGDSK